MLKERKVGLNFSDIEDKKAKPSFSIGYYNWDSSTSTTFENKAGSDVWSLDVASISYNSDILTLPDGENSIKSAIIDTEYPEI